MVAQDQHHAAAQARATQLAAARTQLVTTHAVLFEIGNALAKLRHRAAAVRVPRALGSDPATHVVPISDALYAQFLTLYGSRPDQEWGLVDCASFVVMRELGLEDSLTADRHFEQAGFRALLRGPTS